MALPSVLIQAATTTTWREPKAVKTVYKFLQMADEIVSRGLGTASRDMTYEDAAVLLIGLNASATATGAPAAVATMRKASGQQLNYSAVTALTLLIEQAPTLSADVRVILSMPAGLMEITGRFETATFSIRNLVQTDQMVRSSFGVETLLAMKAAVDAPRAIVKRKKKST